MERLDIESSKISKHFIQYVNHLEVESLGVVKSRYSKDIVPFGYPILELSLNDLINKHKIWEINNFNSNIFKEFTGKNVIINLETWEYFKR